MMKNKKSTLGLLILVGALVLALIFTYLSLNLQSRDLGYQVQEKIAKEKRLKEEIDQLRAKKAKLLDLGRVEHDVIQDLHYQYPEPDQFIKAFED